MEGETEAFDLKIEGELPQALRGVFVRNGPNPYNGTTGHWFLGDGMLHGVRLEDGKATWYRARYIDTPVLGVEPSDGLEIPDIREHQANTSVVHHGGRVLCLAEIGLPFEVSANDLGTIGVHDFGGKLASPMTAHPKIDSASGEMFFFGYGFLPSGLDYHVVDSSGQITLSQKITVPEPTMMHDFQLTATRAVFMDFPLVFDMDEALAGEAMPFVWKPSLGSRIGVMPRSGGEVAWFEIELGYVFHTVNAYDDPNDGAVVLEAIRYASMWENGAGDFNTVGHLHRWRIDVENGNVKEEALDDRGIEFPCIAPSKQGRPYRYSFGLTIDSDAPSTPAFEPNAIIKYDREKGNKSIHRMPGPRRLGETTFVADPNGSAEDDGWLLAYDYDYDNDSSALVVFDARDMSAPHVARVLLPRRVPYGFHGTWVADS
ncbi:MAG: carotenoid oxygenase family protein [Polyangiaceae bacterium]